MTHRISRIGKMAITAVLSGALLFSPAVATAATMTGSSAVSSVSVASASQSTAGAAVAGSGSSAALRVGAPLPSPVAGAPGQAPGAIWIRVAVKAALEVIKRTNKAWYNSITQWVAKGKVAFVSWWNSSVPSWVKGVFGGVSASAIYDALKWILGL